MKKVDIPVLIKIGDYEVIASGIVHTGEVEINFEIVGLKINFTFNTDDGSPRFLGSLNEKSLTIALYNVNEALGEGKLEPVEIGSIGGKSLYVTWFVNTLDNNLRQFNYTFLTKEK